MRLLTYDMAQRRPACVILAAAMGGDPELAHLWPSEEWIVDGPTEGLKTYKITDQQLEQLVAADNNKEKA